MCKWVCCRIFAPQINGEKRSPRNELNFSLRFFRSLFNKEMHEKFLIFWRQIEFHRGRFDQLEELGFRIFEPLIRYPFNCLSQLFTLSVHAHSLFLLKPLLIKHLYIIRGAFIIISYKTISTDWRIFYPNGPIPCLFYPALRMVLLRSAA